MQGLEKLIDLLKTAGRTSFILSLFLFLYLYLASKGIVPIDAAPYFSPAVWLAAILFMAVAVSSLVDEIAVYVRRFLKDREKKNLDSVMLRNFIEEIPMLSDTERRIFGYLLKNNTNRFEADGTGARASSLIAKGYIIPLKLDHMKYASGHYPFQVADVIWRDLLNRRSDFPHIPYFDHYNNKEAKPWSFYAE